MIRKQKVRRNLVALKTRFSDLSDNSPNFFGITDMPNQFTAGKNCFKFRPVVSRFSKQDPIQIEVLDFNGKAIYHEVLDYKESDGSLVVAVYVYEDTTPGYCTITMVGTSLFDEKLRPIPVNERRQNNLKFNYRLYVDPKKRNDSEIIYTKKPKFTVRERKFSIIEEKFSNLNKIVAVSSTASYTYTTGNPKLNSTVGFFQKEFENGIVRFKSLSRDYSPRFTFQTASAFEYTASVESVRTPKQLELSEKATIYGLQGQKQEFKAIFNQPYEVTFSFSPSVKVVTQNVKSYAQIDIEGLEPSVGDVSRVKVFYKSTFKPKSDYELIYDDEVFPKNIFVDTSSFLVDDPIGVFPNNPFQVPSVYLSGPTNQANNINPLRYWKIESGSGVPSASALLLSNDLFGAVQIIPTDLVTGSGEYFFVQTSSVEIPFYRDTDYRLKFDYVISTDVSESRGPMISAYFTGSSFVDNSVFGRYVGSVPTGSRNPSIKLDQEFKIPINKDGSGTLKFLLRRGCQISNIRIEEDIDYGFTQNRAKLFIPLKQDHRGEYLDFKLQFFNYTLKESNEKPVTYDTYFSGGNHYIFGDDNMITGSTYLGTYTGSGIHLYGNFQSGSYGTTSGSAIQSCGFNGIQNATSSNPSSYGWSLLTGNPHGNLTNSNTGVEMINECGSTFDFKSTPPSFDLKLLGSQSSLLIGCSGSAAGDAGGNLVSGSGCDCDFENCGESYIKWDGCKIHIGGVVSTDIEFRPTIDPDPSGTNSSSSYLFVSQSDTPLGVDLYFRQDGNLTKLKWLESALNTGILYGGEMSYSGQTLYVKKGAGLIVEHNASLTQEVSPIIKYVRWNDITSSITNISSSQNTFVYIDASGSLNQQLSFFTPSQYHDYIPLGRVSHYNFSSINNVINNLETTYDQNGQQSEFVRAFGPLKISGYTLSGQTGTLRINISGGECFNLGGFYQQNPELPSNYTMTTQNTASIVRVFRSGSGGNYYFDNNGGSYYTTIDPTKYDSGTTTGSVSNNNWTIQRVFVNPITGRAHVYYGQSVYTTLQNALQSLSTEQFIESDATSRSYVFVGYCIVLSQTTDLTNTTQNTILQGGLFRGVVGGGGGSGASSLSTLTDVSFDTLSNNDYLQYNSTSGKWVNTQLSIINNSSSGRLLVSDGTTNAATASTYLIVSQSVISSSISVGIGTTNTSNEGNLFLGARSTAEGGQLFLQKGTNFTSASMIDNYQNKFRILKGTDTISDAEQFSLNHNTGQITFNRYNTTSSFTGTPIDFLSFDSSGNILTSPSKYKQSIGNTVQMSFDITHNLNDADIQVNSRDNSTGQIYYPSATAGSPPQYTAIVLNSNTVRIAFTSAPSTNQYTIVVSK